MGGHPLYEISLENFFSHVELVKLLLLLVPGCILLGEVETLYFHIRMERFKGPRGNLELVL